MFVGCVYRGDATTFVSGRVVDEAGNPIAGAKVRLVEIEKPDDVFQGKDETTTNEQGDFDVLVTHAPFETKFTLDVSKAGYQPYSVSILKSQEDFEIVLQQAADQDQKFPMMSTRAD